MDPVGRGDEFPIASKETSQDRPRYCLVEFVLTSQYIFDSDEKVGAIVPGPLAPFFLIQRKIFFSGEVQRAQKKRAEAPELSPRTPAPLVRGFTRGVASMRNQPG